MKLSRKIICIILSMTMLVCTGQFATATQEDGAGIDNNVNTEQPAASAEDLGIESEDYAEGEVIVVFKEGTTNSKVNEILSDNDATFESKTIVDGGTVALASIDDGTTVEEAIEELSDEKKVEYAQPNYRYKIEGIADPYLISSSARYQKQFPMTKAKEAWTEVEGVPHAQTTVAVLDTGADIKHVDLKNNLTDSAKQSYRCYSLGKAKNINKDMGEHGTHVAGIIAATYANGKGGAGIASGTNNDLVKLLPVGASSDGMYLHTIDIVKGMNYAASQGAKVINMSFGGNYRDRVQGEAIKALYYNKGITFVAAAGNESNSKYNDPSDMKEVISVCNYDIVDGTTKRGGKTNFGIAKDISAPGVEIWSTVPGDSYDKYTGTSMSTPVVAGVCALVLDVDPELKPEQVRNIICASADDDSVISANRMGSGRVNAQEAVLAAKKAKAAKEAGAPAPAESVSIQAEARTDGKKRVEIYIENTSFVDKGYGLDTIVKPAWSLEGITWTSSDTSIAAVNEHGIVEGKSPGTCEIKAETESGKTDTVMVVVKAPNDPKSIKVVDPPKTMVVNVERDIFNKVNITAQNQSQAVSNEELYWSSSNEKVIIVDDGGIIYPIAKGEATITVSTYNGCKTSFRVKVISLPQKVKFTRTRPWVRYGKSFSFAADLFDNAGDRMTEKRELYWKVNPKGSGKIGTYSGKFTPTKAGVKRGYAYVIAKAKKTNLEGGSVKKWKKVVILKNNYKGKKDYALKKTSVKKRTVRIVWKKIPAADSYLVQRAKGTEGKFETIKIVKSRVVLKKGGTLSYIDRKLMKNRTYRYRIRARFIENGVRKYFGFSNTVKIKTQE